VWAKDNLTTEEMNNKYLLSSNNVGRNAWHLVANLGDLETSQRLWEGAKNNLST